MPIDHASATAACATLKPSDDLSGLPLVPDRHRRCFDDNIHTCPGAFVRLDWDDQDSWTASLSGLALTFTKDENSASKY